MLLLDLYLFWPRWRRPAAIMLAVLALALPHVLPIHGGAALDQAEPELLAQAIPKKFPLEAIAPPALVRDGPPLPRRVFSYADAITVASEDTARLDPHTARYAQYLFIPEHDPFAAAVAKALVANGFPEVTPEQAVFLLISGHVNFLSNQAQLEKPVPIIGGKAMDASLLGADSWRQVRVLRLNLQAYGWSRKVLDAFANPQLNPHFTQQYAEPWKGGVWHGDGQKYEKGAFTEKKFALAPWLLQPFPSDGLYAVLESAWRKHQLERLVGLTGSKAPVVTWAAFIWASAIQFDRQGAGYYDFLAIKDQKTFDKLVGFAEKDSEAFAQPQVEAVSVSGISQEPRLLEFYEKIGGQYVRTKDQVNQRAIGDRNPLEVGNVRRLKADATRIFAHLPNRLWAFGLFNLKDGSRQDSAPDGVGFFHHAIHNDGKIHVCLTCLACHDRAVGNGGLRSFKPYYRSKYAAGNLPALTAVGKDGKFDPHEFHILKQQLLTPIDPADLARRRYIQALHEATGLKPHQYAAALYAGFSAFDAPVDLAQAAYELQVDPATAQRQFAGTLLTSGKIDSVLDAFIAPEGRRNRIGRNQWNERFSLAQLALRGYSEWDAPPRR